MIFFNVYRNWILFIKFFIVFLFRFIISGILTIYWRRCGNILDSLECEFIMFVISKFCFFRVLVFVEFDNKILYLFLFCVLRVFSVFLMLFYDIICIKLFICRVFSNLVKIIFFDKVKLENL